MLLHTLMCLQNVYSVSVEEKACLLYELNRIVRLIKGLLETFLLNSFDLSSLLLQHIKKYILSKFLMISDCNFIFILLIFLLKPKNYNTEQNFNQKYYNISK